MKRNLIEQREKAIIENFAKNYNKIKRLDEQEIEEINIGKGIASLGLAASLAGNPTDTNAQSIQPTQVTNTKSRFLDTVDITTLSDSKAALVLLQSLKNNPFSAKYWAKINKNNERLYTLLNNLLEYQLKTGRIEPEDLEKIGAKYKDIPLSKEFLARDENKTYTMR